MGLCLLAAPVHAFAQPVEPPGAPPADPAPVAGPALLPTGPEGQPLAQTTPSAGVQDRSFPLGLGDVIYVGVIGRSDFSVRARVASDGTVVLPLLGSVPAVGRAPDQLAEDIRGALERGGYFSNPVVRVEVLGVASRYVTVLGFVGQPGLVTLDRDYRLSEILARVGGRNAGGANHVLLTRADGKSERLSIDKIATGVPGQDPIIRPGDRIFIPASENEVFYISGQVRSPGAYPVADGMTYRIAIAKGGGVTDMGTEKKIKVVRNGTTLKKVKLEDPVQPGDVITIGERLF